MIPGGVRSQWEGIGVCRGCSRYEPEHHLRLLPCNRSARARIETRAFTWRTTLLLSIGLAGWTDASLADDRYIGSWVGEARTSTERTSLVLHIEASDTGLAANITLHDVGVTGWPAQSLEATAEGRLADLGPLEWDPRPAVCVVMLP